MLHIKEALEKAGCRVLQNESMALHTSFKTGGEADLYCICKNREEAAKAYLYLYNRDIPFFVTGAGSNILVSDKGFRGVILKFFGDNDITDFGNGKIEASGGANPFFVIKQAQKRGYTGGEFSATIPGSLGGLIAMNAGCYGGEMKDIVCSVRCILKDKEITLGTDECGFGYRTSVFAQKRSIILSVILKFGTEGEKVGSETLNKIIQQRKASQPQLPSAGSVFKRKGSIIPARLIEEAGLKGLRCGNAEVSIKHSGFIVNTGGASSADIYALIHRVKDTIYNKNAVDLEEEIIYIGEFKK